MTQIVLFQKKYLIPEEKNMNGMSLEAVNISQIINNKTSSVNSERFDHEYVRIYYDTLFIFESMCCVEYIT